MDEWDRKLAVLAFSILEPTHKAYQYMENIHDLLPWVVFPSVFAFLWWLLPPILFGLLFVLFFAGPHLIVMSLMVQTVWEVRNLNRRKQDR